MTSIASTERAPAAGWRPELGATVWRVTRRSRSVPETGHVDIDRYELLVGLDSAERARAMLDVA
jgi:hypothetical protein